MVKKLTQAQRLEQEVAGIREALNSILTNHLPDLDTRIGLNTKLILGVYGATFAGAIAVIAAVLMK